MEKNLELFEYFINKMSNFISVKIYDKNSLMFNEGETLDNVFIVKNGTVEIFKITKSWEERIIFILDKGMILNEEIIFSNNFQCSTCCRAFSKAIIYIIPRNKILEAIQSDTKIMEYVFRNSTLKLSRSYRQIKNSGSSISIEKKVASKLWKLSQDYGVKNQDGIEISLSLSSTLIAKMIGATRETVSRCISTLKKEKVISVKNDRISIINMEKLEKKFNNL